MNFLDRIQRRVDWMYRRYVLRDPFLCEVERWFKDRGDETLRLDYPLRSDSVVFDVGAYRGDFAEAIYRKFRCRIFLFEPVPEFHAVCVKRFESVPEIVCCDWGLSRSDGVLDISVAADSSTFHSSGQGARRQAGVRSVTGCLRELGVDEIDLLKLNVEGGEFDILPALIESGAIERVKYLQVQFHNFVEAAADQRAAIRKALARTHIEMWNYEFVWESWARRDTISAL